MFSQVACESHQTLDAVADHAECDVALMTEKSTDLAAVVAVIDMESAFAKRGTYVAEEVG